MLLYTYQAYLSAYSEHIRLASGSTLFFANEVEEIVFSCSNHLLRGLFSRRRLASPLRRLRTQKLLN